VGGAHADPALITRRVGDLLEKTLDELCAKPVEQLLAARYERFRRLGVYEEGGR
jgi:acetyl-CoA carboxylase carboxyl transferase subunit alpha